MSGPANPDHVRGMTPYQECFTEKICIWDPAKRPYIWKWPYIGCNYKWKPLHCWKMKHITEFQLAAEAFPGAPYNDVHKRAKRDSIYDNRIKTCIHACYRPNWFPGYAVGAPSSTLLGAQEVAVPPTTTNLELNQQVKTKNLLFHHIIILSDIAKCCPTNQSASGKQSYYEGAKVGLGVRVLFHSPMRYAALHGSSITRTLPQKPPLLTLIFACAKGAKLVPSKVSLIYHTACSEK